MYTMPLSPMPRRKPEGPTMNFQFRLTAEETKRWCELYTKAQAKLLGTKLDNSEFNRVLIGLKHNDKLITEKDRLYFFAASVAEPRIAGAAPPAKPHIKQVTPQLKRK